jgi:hypothetical protein
MKIPTTASQYDLRFDARTQTDVAVDCGAIMEPLQIGSDAAGAEVVPLPEIQDLADHLRLRGARRMMWRPRLIALLGASSSESSPRATFLGNSTTFAGVRSDFGLRCPFLALFVDACSHL